MLHKDHGSETGHSFWLETLKLFAFIRQDKFQVAAIEILTNHKIWLSIKFSMKAYVYQLMQPKRRAQT